jgi:hypothetical protein
MENCGRLFCATGLLADYLDRISGYREWHVVGIHLARVQVPDDWRRFADPRRDD